MIETEAKVETIDKVSTIILLTHNKTHRNRAYYHSSDFTILPSLILDKNNSLFSEQIGHNNDENVTCACEIRTNKRQCV